MDFVKRSLGSQKVQTGIATFLGGLLVVWLEVDYTEQILTLLGVVSTLLIGGQAALDLKHGSKSDGTGEFADGES